MVVESFARVGQAVILCLNGADGGEIALAAKVVTGDSSTLQCTVSDAAPTDAALTVGRHVRVQVPDAHGLWLANARVGGARNGNSVTLELLDEPARFDRRDFRRASVGMKPLRAVLLPRDDSVPSMVFSVKLSDLSAGGVQFDSLLPLGYGDLVRLQLELDADTRITPVVKVIDTAEHTGDDGATTYSSRGFFASIHSRERQHLARWAVRASGAFGDVSTAKT